MEVETSRCNNTYELCREVLQSVAIISYSVQGRKVKMDMENKPWKDMFSPKERNGDVVRNVFEIRFLLLEAFSFWHILHKKKLVRHAVWNAMPLYIIDEEKYGRNVEAIQEIRVA